MSVKIASITVRTCEQMRCEQIGAELKELAEICAGNHKKAFENWTHGDIEKIWIDRDGIMCVQYSDGAWWHYNGKEWW